VYARTEDVARYIEAHARLPVANGGDDDVEAQGARKSRSEVHRVSSRAPCQGGRGGQA
jgi:hypothetical protein